MPEEKQPPEDRISIGGIFLVFLGIVFLLQSLDVLSWALWGTLWRFWPVLIIIAGLNILLRRHNTWLVSLLIVAVLLACLGLAIWQQEKPLPAGSNTSTYSVPSRSLAWLPSEAGSRLSGCPEASSVILSTFTMFSVNSAKNLFTPIKRQILYYLSLS